jgi:allantoate deiminase
MSAITPVTMLFVRSKGGISHHPAEFTSEADIEVAIKVMSDFLSEVARSNS